MAKIRSAGRRRLDQYFEGLAVRIGPRPPRGWVRTIRDALGMSGWEVATPLRLSTNRISQIEKAEVEGSLRLATLERVAGALHCQLYYVLIPDGSLDSMVRSQAQVRAAAIMEGWIATENEGHAPPIEVMSERINQLADDLAERTGIWRRRAPYGSRPVRDSAAQQPGPRGTTKEGGEIANP